MNAESTAAANNEHPLPRRHVCMGMCSRCPFAKKAAQASTMTEPAGCRNSIPALPMLSAHGQ